MFDFRGPPQRPLPSEPRFAKADARENERGCHRTLFFLSFVRSVPQSIRINTTFRVKLSTPPAYINGDRASKHKSKPRFNPSGIFLLCCHVTCAHYAKKHNTGRTKGGSECTTARNFSYRSRMSATRALLFFFFLLPSFMPLCSRRWSHCRLERATVVLFVKKNQTFGKRTFQLSSFSLLSKSSPFSSSYASAGARA